MMIDRLRYKVYLSLLTSLAIVVHAMESSFPTPFPWLRFGLSNIITLAVIVLFGLKAGMTVTLLKITVGTLLMGTFLTPSFFLAFSGGIASTLVLALAHSVFSPWLSVVGISILGAYTHTLVQVLVAYFILIKHFQVFLLLPFFLTFSLITGFISGLGANYLVKYLREVPNIKTLSELK